MKLLPRLVFVSALALATASASAVTTFTEGFDTNASGWLNGASAAPTYNATGGVGDSGYISYTSSLNSGASGPFGAPALQILFRGNDTANASGDAFVGNWIAAGIQSFSVAVRHNYTETLSLYARFASSTPGAAGSLAYNALYAVAPDTWTTVTFAIAAGNPPFSSYGAGTFNTVFSGIQNVQLGLYVPAATALSNLRLDIDNVSVSAVPEPESLAMFALGGLAVLAAARRKRRTS